MDSNYLYTLFIFDFSKPKTPIIRVKYQSSPATKRIGPFLDIGLAKNRGFILNKEDSEFLNVLISNNFLTQDRLRSQIFLDLDTLCAILDTGKCFIQLKKKGSIRTLNKDTYLKTNIKKIEKYDSQCLTLIRGHVIYEDNTESIYWEYKGADELVSEFPKDGLFSRIRDINGVWHARDLDLESSLKHELTEGLQPNQLNVVLPVPRSNFEWKFSHQSKNSSYSYSYGKIDWFDASNIDYLTQNLGISIDELIESYLHNRNYLHAKDTIFHFEKPIGEMLDENVFTDLVASKIQIPTNKISTIQKLISDDTIANSLKNELSASNFIGTLKKYQFDALFWMLQLRKENLGGILADEMGLGKTIEAIAYMMISMKNGNGPFLIVCPKTLVENWKNEIIKFSNMQRVDINLDSKKIPNSKKAINIITYKSISMHADNISKHQFDTIIIDEAQFVKNSGTMTHKHLMTLKSSCRLVLTGTPIENYLTDLWSLIIFANPFLTSSYSKLKNIFNDFKRNEQAASFSYKTLGNMILRRTKEDVMLNIPPLNSQIIFCEMNSCQRAVYNTTLHLFQKMLSDGIAGRIESIALEAINRLRHACSDPSMLPNSLNMQQCTDSVKINCSVAIIEECFAKREKSIIFTQYHHVTDRLSAEFSSRNLRCFVLDGRTKERIKIINDFEQSENGVFIIGLKSGGFGMNLTSATNVILFDPWWNPAVEEQAFARTHRIGQSKTVSTKKLICCDTIEEKMLKLIASKRQLSNSIFDLSYAPNIDDLVSIISQPD